MILVSLQTIHLQIVVNFYLNHLKNFRMKVNKKIILKSLKTSLNSSLAKVTNQETTIHIEVLRQTVQHLILIPALVLNHALIVIVVVTGMVHPIIPTTAAAQVGKIVGAMAETKEGVVAIVTVVIVIMITIVIAIVIARAVPVVTLALDAVADAMKITVITTIPTTGVIITKAILAEIT